MIRPIRSKNKLKLGTESENNHCSLFFRLFLGSGPSAVVFDCGMPLVALSNIVPCLLVHLLPTGLLQR